MHRPWPIHAGIVFIFGLFLLVVPGVILGLLFWSFYWLIVDEKTSALESFGTAYKIGTLNIITTFLLSIASLVIIVVGILAFFVGILFAAPLTTQIWAVAYLMMSGQPVAGDPSQDRYAETLSPAESNSVSNNTNLMSKWRCECGEEVFSSWSFCPRCRRPKPSER